MFLVFAYIWLSNFHISVSFLSKMAAINKNNSSSVKLGLHFLLGGSMMMAAQTSADWLLLFLVAETFCNWAS